LPHRGRIGEREAAFVREYQESVNTKALEIPRLRRPPRPDPDRLAPRASST
jgi:hypothetical protein